MKALTCLLFVMFLSFFFANADDLRLGMIGLDTSHVTAFTELLNNPASNNHIAGARIVAAFKGGTWREALRQH